MAVSPNESSANQVISVIDIGARYGVHPSWTAIASNDCVRYFAFEPDPEESLRLKEKYSGRSNYQIAALAMGEAEGIHKLHLLKHRGQSSLLKPNPESSWFGGARAGEGNIEEIIDVQMATVDGWCRKNSVAADFLKIDTEGYDYNVLLGAKETISQSVIGIRCEVYFQQSFQGAKEFDFVFRLLRDSGFLLANLDYDGRGAHQSYFCPDSKYGLMGGFEAVFIRDENMILKEFRSKFLKYLIFLFLNNVEDLGFKLMVENSQLWNEHFARDSNKALVEAFDVLFQRKLNKLKSIPGDSFQKAKEVYRTMFKREALDWHNFYQSSVMNP